MRDDLCSIPVSQVFEPKDGCPLCRMRDMLEEHLTDYITGAAMMEPDVRIMTNRMGFCHTHYKMMLSGHRRLPVALMLDSHLAELEKTVFGEGKPFFLKPSDAAKGTRAERLGEECFVCAQVEKGMQSMISTILRMYDSEPDFRRLFCEQPSLCLPHYSLLAAASAKEMPRRRRDEFRREAARIAQGTLTELRQDVRHFCDMYDYRNNTEDADWGNSKDSIERSVYYLTSRKTK